MAGLVDQYGTPLRREILLEEQAVPSMSSVRTTRHQYSSAGITPQTLERYMREADEGDMAAYLELAEQIEEKDPHYAGVLGQRKRAVTSLDIRVDAASDSPLDTTIAQMVRDWVERDELRSDLFDIMDAVGKGFSVCEIIWNQEDASKWTIERIEWRDPRWFEFDRNDGRTLYLKGQGGAPEPLAPYKYIVHQVKTKSGLPIRGGAIRPVSWYWLYKNFSVRDWVIFGETYGQPFRIGKYGPGTSEEDRRVLLRAVANLASDAGAIIPDSMMIEFVKDANPTGSVDLYERLARYCDEQISKAVLGQTTTTDALSGGGLAGNQAHNDVRGDIADDDAQALASTLNRQLVKPLVDLNFGVQKRYPTITIRRPESVDTASLGASLTTYVTLGGKVDAKRAGEMLGVPVAEEGDDVLMAPQAPAAPAFMHAQSPYQIATAAQQAGGDAIEQLADELASDWEPVLSPIEAAINEALTEANNMQEFETKLLAIASMENETLRKRIEQALFAARLAGNLNADVKN